MRKRDEINAFLGINTAFEGKLSFNGAVRIDGHFKGEIHTTGTLVVGETAVLQADIYVAHVIVSGEIRGNIRAGERIEVHAPGRIFGNIQAPILVIGEGVIFEGNCHMQEEARAVVQEESSVE